MQVSPPDSGWNYDKGFLQNLFHRINSLRKSFFWASIIIFAVFLGIGYWLGNHLVLKSDNRAADYSTPGNASADRVITLLEVTDLSEQQPELLSIWFIHLTSGEISHLGFTPVTALLLMDDPNSNLLTEFSLDENKAPARSFLQSLGKIKVDTDGYVILDQSAVAVFLNWLAGKDLHEAVGLEMHTMTEYGQILRGMCQSLPGSSGREMGDFPWSQVADGHFSTSLKFMDVLSNLKFLTSSNSLRCEMVPLP